MSDDAKLQTLVAQVAAAYFSNAHVNPGDIPAVIGQIATSLGAIAAAPVAPAPEPEPAKRATAAQVRKSITGDHLVSFEDGRSYKTLKRHLTQRGLTPETYREKWGLPADYPMTAPNYSARRSDMAKALGLSKLGRGRGGRKRKA